MEPIPTADDDGLLAEINVTPMVDVMLVLLIVFMVTAPMMVAGIQVELPEGGVPVEESKIKIVTLAIDADGLLYFEKDPLHVALLQERLQALAETQRIGVRVKADASVNYGFVVEVLETIRISGITDVGLVTNPIPPRKGDNQTDSRPGTTRRR